MICLIWSELTRWNTLEILIQIDVALVVWTTHLIYVLEIFAVNDLFPKLTHLLEKLSLELMKDKKNAW